MDPSVLKHIAPYIGPVLIFALVVWRMRRASVGRPLKPNRLWIRPAILCVFLALALLHPAAITPMSVTIVAVAAAVGVVLGYVLASHQHLTVDAATGAITSKMSPVGMAVFLALFAARYAVRTMMTGGDPAQAAAPGPQSDHLLLYTDAAMFFALGLVAAQAWETWRRAKALLAANAPKKPESLAE